MSIICTIIQETLFNKPSITSGSILERTEEEDQEIEKDRMRGGNGSVTGRLEK